ncbi:NADH-quinone oxidoreductase subunit N [Sulfurovum sp.]|uniref:NADH-quinone oxidoreductase subunit N n=1 Tax=Sulfurovum sp. TaxID=1969726 RepID=UPI0025E65233|nr:NADH-quinone oxidoreductase subunit N [Sulfurovum sp.]
MFGTFSLLFVAALVSLALHRTKWLKPVALVAIFGSIFLTYSGSHIGLAGFENSEAIRLFTLILEIVLLAVILHEEEDQTLTQTLFIATASVALLQSHTLLTFIVSFEAVSIISFVLVSHIRTAAQAEGAVKMFIAGSIATGILLLGAVLYLIGGGRLGAPIAVETTALSTTGLFVMLLGLFYKLTIVPMHGWAADSYALVRHSHAAILTGVAKTVVAVAMFRFFAPFLAEHLSLSVPVMVTLAVVTMTLGNYLALFQKRIARILAYSSIAHAGYILLAFAALKSGYASTGLLYMAIAYIFMQTAVFLLLDILRKRYGIETLEALKGLAKKNGLLAFFFTVQLFSLAGIPLLAGFMGKAVVFYAAVDAGLWAAVLIALLNSALSVGYYAWIVKHLYFDEAQGPASQSNDKLPIVSQLILLAGTLTFGIFASLVFSVGNAF